jgi:hypothetical protein
LFLDVVDLLLDEGVVVHMSRELNFAHCAAAQRLEASKEVVQPRKGVTPHGTPVASGMATDRMPSGG